MSTIRTVPLLAGAYVGKRLERGGRALTHAALIGDDGEPIRLLCGNASVESVCDSATWTDEPPTCKRCQVRLRILREKERWNSQ